MPDTESNSLWVPANLGLVLKFTVQMQFEKVFFRAYQHSYWHVSPVFVRLLQLLNTAQRVSQTNHAKKQKQAGENWCRYNIRLLAISAHNYVHLQVGEKSALAFSVDGRDALLDSHNRLGRYTTHILTIRKKNSGIAPTQHHYYWRILYTTTPVHGLNGWGHSAIAKFTSICTRAADTLLIQAQIPKGE